MEPNPKVKIISDSTCDLSQELTAKYDIDILPLHILLGENESLASLSYLEKYGAMLALLHSLHPEAPVQADRSFYHRPTQDVLQKLELSAMKSFFTQPLPPGDTVFCHGDFHYANLL